jgi:flagellar motor switch protein FliG
MAVFKGGVEEAAKLLSGLPRDRQKVVLDLIAKQDPAMAKKLESLVVSIEDLRFLTPSMMMDLFKEISMDDLGKALRVGSEELKKHILSNVSSGMKDDIEQILLGPPILVSAVEEASDKIMKVVKRMSDEGTLVLKDSEIVD